jgi:hypothetical protein
MRNQMKTFLLTAMGVFALFSTLTITSCSEDKCKTTVCAYGGVCNDDGSCTCPTGYEGERCETITREKFKGTWNVTEDGTASSPAQYAVSVEDGGAIDEVVIRNFYNLFNKEITAKVKGDTIYIAPTEIEVGEDTKTIEGKGYAVPEAYYGLHGKLVLSYKVTSGDGGVNDFGLGGGTNASIWVK